MICLHHYYDDNHRKLRVTVAINEWTDTFTRPKLEHAKFMNQNLKGKTQFQRQKKRFLNEKLANLKTKSEENARKKTSQCENPLTSDL